MPSIRVAVGRGGWVETSKNEVSPRLALWGKIKVLEGGTKDKRVDERWRRAIILCSLLDIWTHCVLAPIITAFHQDAFSSYAFKSLFIRFNYVLLVATVQFIPTNSVLVFFLFVRFIYFRIFLTSRSVPLSVSFPFSKLAVLQSTQFFFFRTANSLLYFRSWIKYSFEIQ